MKYSIARTAVQNNFLMVSERGFFVEYNLNFLVSLNEQKGTRWGMRGGVNRNFELRYYLNSQ